MNVDQSTTFRPRPVTTAGAHLGKRIPLKYKAKIWTNEFLDLGVLLCPIVRTKMGWVMDPEHEGKVNLMQWAQPTRRITTIQQWNKAFAIFTAIYVEKFPDELQELLAYARNVQRIAERGGGIGRVMMPKSAWNVIAPIPPPPSLEHAVH